MRYCLLLLPLLTLPALAADPPKHRADGDAAVAARRVLLEHCASCHGDADEKKRQGRWTVSDYSTLVGNAGKIPFASLDKDDLRSQVVEFMTDGSMPPGGRKPVPKEQIAAVENWIRRGAPAYPTAFDDDAVLKLIADDIARVEQEKGKEHVQHVRYVSLAHLVDKKGADLAAAEAELLTALAGRTHGDKMRLTKGRHEALKKEPGEGTPDLLAKAVKPVAGSAGTVYRLDLKELAWDGGGKLLFEVTKAGNPVDGAADFRMKPFDLIQLEYPYSHTSADDARKKATDATVAAMNAHRKGAKDPLAQLRAVPFVRGDWLAKALWQKGSPTPLADDLDSLGELAELLGKTADTQVGTGPDFVPFAGGPRVTDATAPPVWAWYQPAVAPAAPPFTFGVVVDGAAPFQPNQKVRLLGDSDKPAAVSLVEVQADFVDVLLFGDEKSRRPTADVTKNTPVAPKADGKIELSPIEPNAGKPIFYVLHASPQASPHREPVVVRSKHLKSAVWRMLPNEEDAAADRGPPVRQVLRIELVAKKKMD